MCKTFLEAFTCADANGTAYMSQDPGRLCGSPRHLALFSLAVPGLLSFGLFYLAAVFFVLWRNRNRLAE